MIANDNKKQNFSIVLDLYVESNPLKFGLSISLSGFCKYWGLPCHSMTSLHAELIALTKTMLTLACVQKNAKGQYKDHIFLLEVK